MFGDEKIQKDIVKLRAEDQLLLLCSRTKINSKINIRIKSLIGPDFNWQLLLSMATKHKLLPLLYLNLNFICPEKVPLEILEKLKIEFHANAKKNLLLTGELVKVMKLLDENGINAVTYKGPVLAHSIYGNIAYRQFGDIDILTDKKGALKSKDIIFSEGYELCRPFKVDDSTYMKLESEYIFTNKENGSKIEINWNFEGKFLYFADNPMFLFDNLKEFNINQCKIRSFSPVNQLLMLSIHAAKHNWNRLSWICDIAHLIQSEEIEWVITLENAEKLGVKRILMINLFLAQDLFGIKLPKQILNYSDKTIMSIMLNIKKRIFYVRKDSLNITEKFLLDITKRENLVHGIKDCFKGLTHFSYNDFEDFALPKQLFVLYPFIRPMLLLKRYGKNNIP